MLLFTTYIWCAFSKYCEPIPLITNRSNCLSYHISFPFSGMLIGKVNLGNLLLQNHMHIFVISLETHAFSQQMFSNWDNFRHANMFCLGLLNFGTFSRTMVFCYQNCSDLLWEKKNLVIEKNIFEITRTIYSNSERSEQFLVTECFFNLFLEVSHI